MPRTSVSLNDSLRWVKSRQSNRDLRPISPLSTGLRPHFSLCATRNRCAGSTRDRDGSPRLTGKPETARRRGRRPKDRSPPDGDEEGFGPIRTTGRGAGRVGLPVAVRGSPWGQATRRNQPKKGRRRSRTRLRSGPRSEATPELVSQDRRAEGLRLVKLANTGRSMSRRRWGLAAMPAPISIARQVTKSRCELCPKQPKLLPQICHPERAARSRRRRTPGQQ
jgi:hypothetical protein